jgi:hypothetical protein
VSDRTWELRKTPEEELRTRTIPHVTEFAKFHHAQGKAEGLAEAKARGLTRVKSEAVLTVVAARGIELTAQQERRIRRSTSQANLDKWLRQAATAHSADEVFA